MSRIRLVVTGSALCFALFGELVAAAPVAAAHWTISPGTGPVGTVITLTGHVQRQDVPQYRRPAYLGLLHESSDCELLVSTPTQRVDVHPDGLVNVRFRVGGSGTCFQGDSGPRRVMLGVYEVIYPCHACVLGRFEVTASAPQVAVTGGPGTHADILALILSVLAAMCLIIVGVSRANRQA